MASILSWAKNAANTVKRDVQGAVAQVNPLDGGRTFQTVQQHGAQYAPQPQASVRQQLAQPVNRALGAVDRRTIQSPLGRGLQTVGLGALQTGVEGLQGVAGLTDAANHKLGVYQGTSPITRDLTRLAKNIDATAKSEHSNKLLYHGTQVAGNVAGAFLGGAVPDAMKAIPGVGKVVQGAQAVDRAAQAGIAAKTANLAEHGIGGRVVANTIRNIAKPGVQAANAAYTGLQAGQQIANGRKVTPSSVAQNLAIGGVGFPAAGAAAHEVVAPVARKVLPAVQKGVQTLKDNHVIAPSRLSKDEVNSLSTFLDKRGPQMDKPTEQRGVAAAKKAGIHPQDYQGMQNLVDAHAEYQGNRVKLKPVRADQSGSAPMDSPIMPLNRLAGEKQSKGLSGEAAPTKLAESQAGGISSTENTPQIEQNSLTKGAKQGRQNVSPETQAQVSGEHTVRNTQALADASQQAVDSVPTNTAVETAHGMLAQPLGHVTDEQTGYIAKTIEKTDAEATQARAAGNTVEADRLTREAAALHDGLSEHAVARGQANQALTMMYNRSPQGLFYSAIRDLKKAGVEDTPELRARLQPLIDAVKTAKGEAEKADALANFHQAVSQTMPQNVGDKLMGIWKAGLLSGVKTQQGNAISNAVFAGLKKVSDVPATVVDSLMSVFTGERTKTATGTGGLRGTVEGTRNGTHTMKTGVDRRNAGDKYEQHAEINFKHPVLNKTLGTAVRTVFRGMNAADQPFWYGAFKNSMYDQAKADGINKGLGGKALRDHMDNLVANPTDKMANTALKEANKSTLNYNTIGSKAIQYMHKGIDNMSGVTPAGAKIAHGVLNVLAPFVRVPTAFLSRTVDFTPLGIGKEIFHQIASKQFDQRAISQAIGEGLTGTGAIALGVALSQHNMLSGDYPKNDPKEAQRWKAEGITPNSLKVGGKWVSLNYFGPLGLLFNAGHQLENAKGENAAVKVGTAIGGLGQGLLGQSFLQGFTGFSDAIKDPNRNLKSFVNSQAGSIVPSIVNDVANATDSMQRQADNVGQSIKSRIPGLRETNKPKQDVYGNALKQPSGPLGTLVGFKPSNDLTTNNPVTSEVSRLHAVNPNDTKMQVTPSPIGRSITVGSTTVNLNDKQRYDLQKQVGQSTQSAWSKLINTPKYKAMDDSQKAKALSDIRGKASEDAQRAYVVAQNLGTYNKPESKGAIKLSNGDITGALSKSKGSGGATTSDYNKSPDAEYKAAQARFDTNKSSMNDVQKIKAQTNLNKLKIGSQYDKSIRDLYSASKATAYQYVSTNKDGKAIADKLQAYDQALYDAGLVSYKKYSNGIAPAAKKGGSGRGRSTASRRSVPGVKVGSLKAPRLKTVKVSSSFKTPKLTAPKMKSARKSIPKFATKTPKLNVTKGNA